MSQKNPLTQRNIFFLHGFASAGFGGKPQSLQKAFGASRVLTMNFPADTEATIAQLKFIAPLLQENNTLLLGSSLGGFYAAWMSHVFGLEAILVNPALDAHLLLQEYKEQEITNYKTSEKYFFTEKDTNALSELYVPLPQLQKTKEKISFYLDKEDERLDSKKTAEIHKDFYVVMYEGGNHSFAHMSEMIADIVRRKIIQ